MTARGGVGSARARRTRPVALLALIPVLVGCEYYMAYKLLGGGRSARWHSPAPAVPSQAQSHVGPPAPTTEVAADLLERSDGTRWLRVSPSRAAAVLAFRRVCDDAPTALWTGPPPRAEHADGILLPLPPAPPPAPGEPACLPARQRLYVFAVSGPSLLEGILVHATTAAELMSELRAQRGPDLGVAELPEPAR